MSFKRPQAPAQKGVGVEAEKPKTQEKESSEKTFSLFEQLFQKSTLMAPKEAIRDVLLEGVFGKPVDRVQQELDQRATVEQNAADLLRRLK